MIAAIPYPEPTSDVGNNNAKRFPNSTCVGPLPRIAANALSTQTAIAGDVMPPKSADSRGVPNLSTPSDIGTPMLRLAYLGDDERARESQRADQQRIHCARVRN